MDVTLITDWLFGREGGFVLRWWLLVTLAGAAVWPLLFRLMAGLPDRGYTLARAAGLMLTGFVFWFLGTLGLLRNTPGAMVFAWLVVLAASWGLFLRWPDRPPLRLWLREHRALILVTELLFALLLFGWAVIRAHNPEMSSTEKPMEIMFINSIRASATFPPHDAWLSGYAISYYYFGYVIIAMLADLSAISSGIAFNITIALLFSLTGIGALGVVYNLVRPRGSSTQALAAGVLGMCFLILMGSLGTALVEFPYTGYTSGVVDGDYFDFWDVEGRASATEIQQSDGTIQEIVQDRDSDGIPDWEDGPIPLENWSFMYGLGWRYSRVVHDRNLDGTPVGAQPITEFPNFSFALADIHPHVLALPFALLAIGLALNLVMRGHEPERWEFPLYAIWVGGMIFMNSWDAIYLPLLVGAEVLRHVVRNGTGVLHVADLRGLGRFVLLVVGLSAVLYLPWLISFTSQASGVLPNVIYPTAWQQYFLQFGAFVVILAVFLLVEQRRARWRFNWQAGALGLTIMVVIALFSFAGLGRMAWNSDEMRGAVFGVYGPSNLPDLLPDILERRLIGLPSELLLAGFVFLVVGRLFARPAVSVEVAPDGTEGEPVPVRRTVNYSPAAGFALLLAGAGAVLTFAPDFIYLHDNFAQRINTVFKLYYQGWIMFSLASAYAVWSVLAGAPEDADRQAEEQSGKVKRKRQPVTLLPTAGRGVFGAVVVILFAAGLLYPAIAVHGRALRDTGRLDAKERHDACERGEAWAGDPATCPTLSPLTLDGVPSMVPADEYQAVQCLDALDNSSDAILVEAPCHCGYQPHYGRFSALTGIPTLMGWGNHEGQWRGEKLPELINTRVENGQRRDRFSDVQELYTTQDWTRAWSIIDRYGIDYVVVGNAERVMIQELAGQDTGRLREYQMGMEKFARVLTPVCQSGGAVVYRVAPQ